MATTRSRTPLQATTATRYSSARLWPGEWDPTGLEVHEANQSPETTFRERFKVALLQSEDGQEYLRRGPPTRPGAWHTEDTLMDTSIVLESPSTSDQVYTYPMSMLSEVPMIPDADEVARLQSAFFTSFKQHVFLDAVAIPDSTLTSPAPYMQLALACLGSQIAPYTDPITHALGIGPQQQTEVASALFDAGVNLWGVVMEVDNRETRRLETVLTAHLLATYGMLSTDKENWRVAGGLLHNTATMARRLRLTESIPQINAAGGLLDRSSGMKSSLLAYMFLNDIVYAIYSDAAPTYSTTELCIKMPSSDHSFRTVYRNLLHGHSRLPPDLRSREDCLLLLTGLLNDIVYLSRSNQGTQSFRSFSNQIKPLRNPYATLSAQSEFSRMSAQLRAALERWMEHFKENVEKDVLALYHFSHLCLACPDIAELPSLAGYDPGSPSMLPVPPGTKQFQMSDKALDLAWLVLDTCDMQSEPASRRVSIWLPVVLFLSALVMWQRLRHRSQNDIKYGTLKVLSMFKNEILQLPWPCCPPMAVTLDRLMRE